MTGNDFVKLCMEEKKMISKEYFDDESKSEGGEIEESAYIYFMNN